jgi:ionotropic glutamate receptor
MASDGSEQMSCIAALVHSYNWKRVVVIYEDDVLGSESGNFALLTEALQEVGSEIEYRLVLPPFSFLTDPIDVVQDELMKLKHQTEARVFIVLQSSLPMLTCILGEAKKAGLVGNDTVWIVANSITSFLGFCGQSCFFFYGRHSRNQNPLFFQQFLQKIRSTVPETFSVRVSK